MPLRGSPLSRLRREGGAPGGLAEPVPRVPVYGLPRGPSIVMDAPVASAMDGALRYGKLR